MCVLYFGDIPLYNLTQSLNLVILTETKKYL